MKDTQQVLQRYVIESQRQGLSFNFFNLLQSKAKFFAKTKNSSKELSICKSWKAFFSYYYKRLLLESGLKGSSTRLLKKLRRFSSTESMRLKKVDRSYTIRILIDMKDGHHS